MTFEIFETVELTAQEGNLFTIGKSDKGYSITIKKAPAFVNAADIGNIIAALSTCFMDTSQG